MNRCVLVALADLHSGHKLGLCNPDTILWGEDQAGEPVADHPSLSRFQEYTWEYAQLLTHQAAAFADGDPITIIHNGDLTHGSRYGEGLSYNTVDDQTQIGYHNLEPWFSLPNVIAGRLVLGTAVHTFDGSSEAIITRHLRAQFPDCDIRTISHSLLTVGGVSFDIAHHGPSPGSKNWTTGNPLRSYLQDLILCELHANRTPPRVVMRAHYHQWIPHETASRWFQGETYSTVGVLLPSMCGLTAHGRQATKSTHMLTLGCVCFEMIDGELARIKPMVRHLDLRTKERIGDG